MYVMIKWIVSVVKEEVVAVWFFRIRLPIIFI